MHGDSSQVGFCIARLHFVVSLCSLLKSTFVLTLTLASRVLLLWLQKRLSFWVL
jgi:hypothetical protein